MENSRIWINFVWIFNTNGNQQTVPANHRVSSNMANGEMKTYSRPIMWEFSQQTNIINKSIGNCRQHTNKRTLPNNGEKMRTCIWFIDQSWKNGEEKIWIWFSLGGMSGNAHAQTNNNNCILYMIYLCCIVCSVFFVRCVPLKIINANKHTYAEMWYTSNVNKC